MAEKKIFKNSEDRLARALRENRGTYTISKDGYISLDMSNKKVRDSFRQQIEHIRKLTSEGKLTFK